jgi:TRAP transporter TAXI family solute receptor
VKKEENMKNGIEIKRRLGLKIFGIFLITTLFIFTTGTETPCATKPKTIIWGSAAMGSSGYVIIEALTSTLNRNEKSFKNASISTQGSVENLMLLSQKEIHLGQTSSSELYLAHNGLKPFPKKIDFTQVLGYTYWAVPVGVPLKSPIKKIEELEGKRVSMGAAGGATVVLWQSIFDAYGIKISPIYLPWQGAADAMKTGQVDAVTVVSLEGSMPIPAFEELRLSHPYRLLDTDVEKIKSASKINHGVLNVKVTSTEPNLNAPGYAGILAADPELDEELVYKICSTLYGNEQAVRRIDRGLGFFKLENALKMVMPQYPIHKGAVKFYKEKGMWRDDLIISK